MKEITVHPVDYAAAYSAVVSRTCAAFAYLEYYDIERARSVLGEAMEIRRLVESPIVVCKTGDPSVLESNTVLDGPKQDEQADIRRSGGGEGVPPDVATRPGG